MPWALLHALSGWPERDELFSGRAASVTGCGNGCQLFPGGGLVSATGLKLGLAELWRHRNSDQALLVGDAEHPCPAPSGYSGRSWPRCVGVRLYSGDRMMQALHLLIVVGGST